MIEQPKERSVKKRWLILGATIAAVAVDTAASLGLIPEALRGLAGLLAALG